MSDDPIAGIGAAVAEGFADQVAFLERLTACASVRAHEEAAQDIMEQACRERGFEIDRWTLDAPELAAHPALAPATVDYSKMSALVATHRGRGGGRSLILNGHIDVVPPGPAEHWTTPAFAPRREGDWLYGRGAGDMKAGLVANLFALDALRRLGVQPAGRVHLQSVPEEESTGNGALACAARGYIADAALVTEPFDEELVRANTGTLWFRIRISGRPVHVFDTGAGGNAIEAAGRMMVRLKELEAAWNARKGGCPPFADHPHPINLNIGRIEGGDWASSVPAWCDMDCRIAFYPGETPAEAMAAVEAFVAEVARGDPLLAAQPPVVEWNGFTAEGYVLEPGSDAEAALARAHRTVTGRGLKDIAMPCYLDGRVFAVQQGIPTLVYGPLAENIHGFDERVNLPSVQRVTETVARFIADWCGLEPV
ncbi:acetylornithine deacetylase [Maritimibacter sp. 55A14]|uniref:ArgE/DapE family deacylase n=1 Tax=Maritimibacter sp. 55A14 TaxID=2174844 RepID=UPI000D60CFD4|nr:ArgE/DapE family deacylase [Maritimibacter sp. 55A14]PWE32592.1 acetylornithine deacetylase [Maritimibacter sp. 55A14]